MAEEDNDEQLDMTDDIDAEDQGSRDEMTYGVGGDAAGASLITDDVGSSPIAGSDTGDEGRGGQAIGRATGVTTGTTTKGAAKKSGGSSKGGAAKSTLR